MPLDERPDPERPERKENQKRHERGQKDPKRFDHLKDLLHDVPPTMSLNPTLLNVNPRLLPSFPVSGTLLATCAAWHLASFSPTRKPKFMAKKVKAIVKIQAPAGKATPAPPIGPTLGQHGVNIQDFVQKFNAATAKMAGDIVPAVLTIYEDRTFDFILKTPPASTLLMKAAGLEKGSGKPLQEKVGKVTKAQIREIAEKKLPDLNTTSIESAMRTIEGTARQMGLEVKP